MYCLIGKEVGVGANMIGCWSSKTVMADVYQTLSCACGQLASSGHAIHSMTE